MPVAGGVEFFGENELEHTISRDVFTDADRAAVLEGFGYHRDMVGNLRGLYISLDIAGQLADIADDHPFKQFLRDTRAGTVAHRGGDVSVGGFQEGKTRFQIAQIDEWIERSNLSIGEPGYISQEALRYGIDYISKFSDDLATGLVKDADGRPVGVLGGPNTQAMFAEAFDRYTNGFDPSFVDDPNNSVGQQARLLLDPYRATILSADMQISYTDANGEFKSSEARFDYMAKQVEAALGEGYITPEQYNDIIDKLGKSRTNGARIRNAGIQLYRDVASKLQADIGRIAEHTVRFLSEGRAVAVSRGTATVVELEQAVQNERILVEIEQANRASLPSRFADFGPETARAIHKSAIQLGNKVSRVAGQIEGSSFNSFKGVLAGLGIGYADHVYDSVKKGWETGDWSDYWINTAQYGAVATIAVGGISVVTALVAGTAIAPFVGAGLVVAGVVGTGVALGNLAANVINDLLGLERIPEDPGAIAQAIQDNQLFLSQVGERILYDWINGELGKPRLEGIEIVYLADDQGEGHPDQVKGTGEAELFYADNGAKVDGGAGGDEIYHSGYGTAFGGAGQDVLVGVNAKVLRAGEYLYPWMNEARDQRVAENARIAADNIERAELGLPLLRLLPSLPESPKAQEDLTLKLDGGADNDIVFAIGGSLLGSSGDRVTTIGGMGRDWIYNRSKNGVIWGDVENSVEMADGSRVYFVEERNEQGEITLVPTAIADDKSNADNFWYAPDVTIMDAQKSDYLKFYGVTLTGGEVGSSAWSLMVGARSRNLMVAQTVVGGVGAAAAAVNIGRQAAGLSPIYYDTFLPFIAYTLQDNGDGGQDLIVHNMVDSVIGTLTGSGSASSMVVKNFDMQKLGGFTSGLQALGAEGGDLGMVFRDFNPAYALAALAPVVQGIPILQSLMAALGALTLADAASWTAAAALRLAKGAKWASEGDPLVIDLDGDGIETVGLGSSNAYFDIDGDQFAELTGWLKGDDGFLVLDGNGNGRIDDISEMFGNRFEGGYAELAQYDSNSDGKISAADLIWSELQIWQDYDRDGETDAGELKSLDALGIVSLSLAATALDATTTEGTRLLSYGSVTFDSGRVSTMFEAIFSSNDSVTKYAGEAGRAPWQSDTVLNAKGFGNITDLAVAAANDVSFAELAQSRAAAMTAPNLRTLVAQAGDVLGAWGATLETSRELVAVRLGADGSLLEHRPWDGGALEAGWTLEQGWSPSDRGVGELPTREEVPYLVQVVNGRAVILDYGISQGDGTWKLASDPSTTYATVADIMALGHAAGTEWRREDIQANPLADLPVETIGVYFINGEVKDYTVQVTDNDGSFYVWARNLDRALQLQAKSGAAFEFNLRNYEVDLATLDEVNSTDDSTYRVELLTSAQFHFATSLGGIDFRPEMLTATYDNITGQLDYTVNGVRGAGRYMAEIDADGNPVIVTYSDGTTAPAMTYESDVKTMIAMLQPVMEQYIVTSRRFAVRMALQGGLSDYARGLSYDAARDVYTPTTDRQLAPMFDAIFEAAPASNADDAVLDYLTDWNEILWQVYPDYAPTGAGNLFGGAVGVDQAFIMQMLIPAFEARGWTYDPATGEGTGLDIRGVAHALSINEERIITHAADVLTVSGTSGTDYFYMTAGDQTLSGGNGADFYFVGADSGNDVIHDQDVGGDDELRFTAVDSGHVKAVRDGEDLILQILDDEGGVLNTVRLTDQFLGELNPYLSNGKQMESGVNQIVFSDGVIWDRFRMAMQVADPRDSDDVYVGSGSGDVLWGGKGNDVLTGGLGGDIYVFQRGDGHDVISERGGFSFGPVKAGLDFLTFRGDITADDLVLRREGVGTTLFITILDSDGNPTGDAIDIEDYFGGISLGLGLFGDLLGSSEGLDYVSPNLIERFIFDDGTSLEFTQVAERVLANAKTAGDDAI